MIKSTVGSAVKHSVLRAGSVLWVFLVIGIIGWSLYAVIIKPQVDPIKTHAQKAESITNITELKEEEAIVLSLFPPRIKLGAIDVKIFGRKK